LTPSFSLIISIDKATILVFDVAKMKMSCFPGGTYPAIFESVFTGEKTWYFNYGLLLVLTGAKCAFNVESGACILASGSADWKSK